MTWVQVVYRLRGKEDSEHIDAVRQSALAFVADHKVADIVELGEEIYDETMARRIWQGTRDLALRHLAAGQRVWLVTATPVELGRDHRQPARPDRRARHGGRDRGRRLHRRAGRRPAARRGQGRGGARAGRARGPRPGPLLGLQRLGQRPADARRWSATRTRSTRTAGCSREARERGWPVHDFRTGPRATHDRAARPPRPARWPARIAAAAALAAAARTDARPRSARGVPRADHGWPRDHADATRSAPNERPQRARIGHRERVRRRSGERQSQKKTERRSSSSV